MKKKKNHHHNNTHHHNDDHNQLDLSGNILTVPKPISKNNLILLECFDAYSDKELSPWQLVRFFRERMHQNTVNNFITYARDVGWISEIKPIKGAEINSLFSYKKEPDYLPSGQKVTTTNFKYYQITEEGQMALERHHAHYG